MQHREFEAENRESSIREKKEQITEKNDQQDDLKNESRLDNPSNPSQKKELSDEHKRPIKTRRETHHEEQDAEQDQEQEAFQLSKKLHSESTRNTPNIDSKVSNPNTGPGFVSIDDAYTSFEKLTSLKNQIESMSHKVESMANKFKVDSICARPEDFKIPAQDLDNINKFVLSYPGDFSAIIQGLFGNNLVSEVYNAGITSILNGDVDNDSDEEEEEVISSFCGSDDGSESRSSSKSIVG